MTPNLARLPALKPFRWAALAALTLGAALAAGGPPAVAATAGGPAVTLPPTGTHGYPFLADPDALKGTGFTEDEFFLQGTAQSYQQSGTWKDDGRWAVKPLRKAAYKTRVLVRRPSDPARFNGTVLVEWLNVTGTIDTGTEWPYMQNELLDKGYAWVGVTAQEAGVNSPLGLKNWDRARYGSLSHPGDAYSFDIFTQAARVARAAGPGGILGGLRPTTVLGAGESQSALRLAAYVNTQAKREHAFDGFVIHSNAYFATGLADGQLGLGLPAPRIRTDLDAKTLLLQTETDVSLNIVGRQPDSPSVHTWEVVGTAHADAWMLDHATGPFRKALGLPVIDFNALCGPGNAPINDGPGHDAADAALAAVKRWARTGAAPPGAPQISVTSNVVDRDPATGIALGGVRLPDVSVPVKTLSGQHFGGIGVACSPFGATDVWNGDRDAWDRKDGDPSDTSNQGRAEPSPAKLYGSPGAYAAKVQDAVTADVAAGFLTPEDGDRIVAAARRTTF